MGAKNNKMRFAFVIPVYNHAGTMAQVVRDAQALSFPVFVVDDGSTDNTYDQIKEIEGIKILRHDQNQGKGAAIMTGFAAASAVADFAITIDADGQHYPRREKTHQGHSEKNAAYCRGSQRLHARRTRSLDKQIRQEVFQLLGTYRRRPDNFRYTERISCLSPA